LGTLHFVKALKELQDIDLSQIQKMISLANQLQAMNVQKEQITEAVGEKVSPKGIETETAVQEAI